MNWDAVGTKWMQLKRSVKQQWVKLTDDDRDYAAGPRDRLVGRLQEKYGINRLEAERQANDWFKTHQNPAA